MSLYVQITNIYVPVIWNAIIERKYGKKWYWNNCLIQLKAKRKSNVAVTIIAYVNVKNLTHNSEFQLNNVVLVSMIQNKNKIIY